MGAEMARNLSGAGVPLVTYDIDSDRLDLVEESGIETATSSTRRSPGPRRQQRPPS